MKHGRFKAARKTLKFFTLNANIKPPYKVLLDGNFLAAAMKFKVPLMERICGVLQTDEVILYVTRSALDELDNLPQDNDFFARARQFGLDECEIIERSVNDQHNTENSKLDEKTITSPSQDIINLVKGGNKNEYFIASQDKVLAEMLRELIYVPLLWLTNGVLIFDKPSKASLNASKREERVKQKTGGGTMTHEEANLIKRLRKEQKKEKKMEDSTTLVQRANIRKRKKAKEPNPLSCKKKKIDQMKATTDTSKKQRRRKKSKNAIGE